MRTSKTLGIVGGLGPLASVRFCELLTRLTPASCDQEHIDFVLFSRASIPDRTAFLTGASGDSPLPAILEVVRSLNELGVDYIAMPCVTAHCFTDEIRAASRVPVLSMIEETVEHLRSVGVKSAGILGTDGTVKCGIFQAALESAGIKAVLPDSDKQSEVMAAINAVKGGQTAELTPLRNSEVSLLACTELSLLLNSARQGNPVRLTGVENAVCLLEILARKAIELCSPT